ncbi:MAG: diguanylate cyclase, partial [Nitrospirae bacterium]|nr:diguanylate cyclase [Nitrospirota bacterium]
KVAGLEAGADDYMPKPFSEIELNARIYACLRTKALQDELRQKNRELERLLERVEFLAMTDSLTELYNRRHFETVLEKEFQRTLRYKSPLSCLMLDIDNFKQINDEYSHQAGDSVLQEIARLIKSSFREIDIVARWGGEEFTILLPQTDRPGALKCASRLLEEISGHKFSRLAERKVTVSIGVATSPDPSIENGEQLVNVSDLAMYEAKRKGRNRAEIMNS